MSVNIVSSGSSGRSFAVVSGDVLRWSTRLTVSGIGRVSLSGTGRIRLFNELDQAPLSLNTGTFMLWGGMQVQVNGRLTLGVGARATLGSTSRTCIQSQGGKVSRLVLSGRG